MGSVYLRGGIIFTSVFLVLTGMCLVGLAAGLVSTITSERNGGTYAYKIEDHVLYGVPQYVMGSVLLVPALLGISMISYNKGLIVAYLLTAFLSDLGMLAVIGYHGSVFEDIVNKGTTVTRNLNVGVIFLECLAFLLLTIGLILGAVLLFKYMVLEQRYHGSPPPYPMKSKRGGDHRMHEKPTGWYDPYYNRPSPRAERIYVDKYAAERGPPRGYREAEYY